MMGGVPGLPPFLFSVIFMGMIGVGVIIGIIFFMVGLYYLSKWEHGED